MTTKQDAMEAAARAALAESEYARDCIPLETMARMMQPAITAYLAAREAEGFYMIHMSEFLPVEAQAAIANHKLKQSLAARPTNGD